MITKTERAAIISHIALLSGEYDMFTTDNTDGFTADQIETMNEALAILVARNPDAREYSLTDAINNAWVGGQTATSLAAATRF